MPPDGDASGCGASSGSGGTLRSKPQTLEADLARLEGMDIAGLGRAWERRHGSPPSSPPCPTACSAWRSLTTCRRMSMVD